MYLSAFQVLIYICTFCTVDGLYIYVWCFNYSKCRVLSVIWRYKYIRQLRRTYFHSILSVSHSSQCLQLKQLTHNNRAWIMSVCMRFLNIWTSFMLLFSFMWHEGAETNNEHVCEIVGSDPGIYISSQGEKIHAAIWQKKRQRIRYKADMFIPLV